MKQKLVETMVKNLTPLQPITLERIRRETAHRRWRVIEPGSYVCAEVTLLEDRDDVEWMTYGFVSKKERG